MKTEQQLQQILAKQLNGKTEVITKCGRIDILTDKELIEIKEYRNWKVAIGQLLSYSKFFPKHQLVMYVYGRITTDFKTVLDTCSSYNIILKYDSGIQSNEYETDISLLNIELIKNEYKISLNEISEYIKDKNSINIIDMIEDLKLKNHKMIQRYLVKVLKLNSWSLKKTSKCNLWIKE